MKKISKKILKIEEVFVTVLLASIAILVFWSAIARTIGKPINWAQDIALLMFAWLTFIGGDLICKSDMLINIDMIFKVLPKSVQKTLAIIFNIFILIFLGVLIRYGFILVTESWNRMFNTLPLSYAWATLSVPTGATLMFLTISEKLINDFKKPVADWRKEI